MKRVGRGARVRRASWALVGSVILALAGAAAPLAAQTAPASNGATDAIGPEQLRNFSLGAKTVPQLPDQAVPPELVPPSNTAPATRVVRTTPRPAAETSTSSAPTPVPPAQVAANPASTKMQPGPSEPAAPRPAASGSVTFALPPADPLSRKPTPATDVGSPRLSGQPLGSGMPFDAGGDDNYSLLPWIVALLVLAGAAIFYALRWRARPLAEPALAGVPSALSRDVELRRFPPVPAPPAPIPPAPPQPRAAAPSGGITIKRPDAFAPPPQPVPPVVPPADVKPIGIVSTRLRPWLEIEFDPTQAVIDPNQASVQFDVVVINSGSGPARRVLVEACMVNAGPEQDVELKRFFDTPVGAGDRIDAIPPLGRISLKSAVSLPLDQVRAYEVGGRRLFVPLVAFNALYEWGAGQGQSSAAFVLGRSAQAGDGEGDGDAKMAPLRLDQGPRAYRGLEGRRHPLGIRR